MTLSGGFGTRSTTVSDEQGNFRFLALDHGRYKSQRGHERLQHRQPRRSRSASGRTSTCRSTLKVASVEESVTVTAETPVVDTKKIGIQHTIDKDELTKIPTSRDPWSLLASVPGVVMDRVNVAGAESGQQGNYVGKGADPKNNVWTLDGVVITDMATRGASPTLLHVRRLRPGAGQRRRQRHPARPRAASGINFVTKRGTNAFHGGAYGYFTHDDLQSSNIPAELATTRASWATTRPTHIEQISDYSFEISGPILKDKLWFWGSYGK